MTRAQFTKRLRVLRAERGWTQRATAQRAGLSPWRYWNLESGGLPPTPEDLARLARAFGLSIREAFPFVE
jgi:transcriptional regulator with XRE-family HTH domain